MAARFYVFTPGSPGYISAEVAFADRPGDPHWAGVLAEDACLMQEGQRILSRSEAFMVPLYREALECWERRDDDILQATQTADRLARAQREVTGWARLGCRDAAAALVELDGEAIYDFAGEHNHLWDGCGGHYPEEALWRAQGLIS